MAPRLLFGTLLLTLLWSGDLAASPSGRIFLGSGGLPVAASDSRGRTLVVWRDSSDVDARFLSSKGVPLGPEFTVNDTPARSPGVDMKLRQDDGFVVAYLGVGSGIRVRRFDSSGAPVGASVLVTSDPVASTPHVGMAPDGRFVVFWGTGVADPLRTEFRARLYDAELVPVGNELLVYTEMWPGGVYHLGAAMSSAGNWLVVIGSFCPNDQLVFAYDSTGNLLGGPEPLAANPADCNREGSLGVVPTPAGDYLVAWGDGSRVFARFVSALGIPTDEPRVVAQPGSPLSPFVSVAADPTGGYMVAWASHFLYFVPPEMRGQRLAPNGGLVGPSFLVINLFQSGYSVSSPVVSVEPGGAAVFVWDHGQQGSAGITARVFPAAFSPIPMIGIGGFLVLAGLLLAQTLSRPDGRV